MIKSCILSFSLFLMLAATAQAFSTDLGLLQEGKKSLENGQYEKAVSCLGKLLMKSGNESEDPQVMALHLTIQAYGMLQLKDRSYDSTVENKLLGAISQDPEWSYPKKLLGELRHFKN